MRGVHKLKHIALSGALCGVILMSTPQANAHVVVKPAEVAPAGFVTFAVSVPNERTMDTVKIRLVIPQGLEHVTPTVKPGWKIETKASGTLDQGGHQDTNVSEIIWTGGMIPEGQRDDFTFSAKAPSETGELTWKAYQTYADGAVVAWDKSEDEQPKKADGTPDFSKDGPFSVTEVREASDTSMMQQGTVEDKTAKRALYTAIAALSVALLALVYASRPKQK